MRDELRNSCATALDAAHEALAWINDLENAERIGSGLKGADHQLRRAAIAVRKTLTAIERPMCISVFGPSQAGKSYLVSALARRGDKPCMAKFGDLGREVDFLREINPAGGRESTGLVTRLSIREESTPAGAPVVLRLLSETDIAKILGNSFLLDGEPKRRAAPSYEKILETLGAARNRASPSPLPTAPNEEALWDLRDYFEKQFAGLGYVEMLSGYWSEAIDLAGRLPVPDRAALFSVLWGNVPQFTRVYVELVTALEKLGAPETAYCPIDALLPRSKTVVDVATLKGLCEPVQEELAIRAFSGPSVMLPRPVVTALAAELRITISEQPYPFFEHTDLLDFPGARSRQKVDFETIFDNNPDALNDLFRRGKVAFLFDRYVAEQEISGMLLCIPPSNQEVIELPDMIDSWIRVSHGETAEERARTNTALCLVLTKMDEHFTEKTGAQGSSLAERFEARLSASLTSYFGKTHQWPFDWAMGKPFQNTFWLRNPEFKAEFMIRYDNDREVEVLPEKVEKIAALREAFLGVADVRQHFADPARAFDEAMKLNDGGITFLAASLEPISRPEIKYEQIRQRMRSLLGEIRRPIAPYYVDSDVNKRLEERLAAAERILEGLSTAWETQKFGSAMRLLQISQNGVAEHLHVEYGNRLKRMGGTDDAPAAISTSKPKAPSRPASSAPALPGRKKAVAEQVQQPIATSSRKTTRRESYLADAAIGHWTENLYGLLQNDDMLSTLCLDRDNTAELVTEILVGARRIHLADRIANGLAEVSGNAIERPDVLLEKAGFFATSEINRFVSMLGFDNIPEDQRPKAPDASEENMVTVFARRPVQNSCEGLPKERTDFARAYLSEWMYAFHQMVRDNVLSGEGLTINVEQNERLKRILETVDAQAGELNSAIGDRR